MLLHEGYDWQRTRKKIEDEMKVMRKRLEKIRQLLASGQTADDSIERPSSLLYNSIFIGLDQSQTDFDRAALLAAIDEELDDLDGGGGDTASQSSWQSLPTVRGPKTPQPAPASTSNKARLRGKRLTRSKKAQVEISLGGIRGDVELYGPTDETASKIEVNVKSLEILDHIRTSTWKKFLTEMKADSRGNVRETDADMVQLSMTTVRPSLPALAEEVRLKVSQLSSLRQVSTLLRLSRRRSCRSGFTLIRTQWTSSSACPASSHLLRPSKLARERKRPRRQPKLLLRHHSSVRRSVGPLLVRG